MRRLIARAALLSLLLAAGCGNWSDSDAEFLAAIPRKEDLTLSAPAAQQTQQLTSALSQRDDALGASTVYSDVVTQVDNINQIIAGLTAGLDFVRTLPPSQRLPDARVWGPHQDDKHPNFQVQIVIRRDAPASYSYEVQLRRIGTQDFSTVIKGTFFGERASRGNGGFQIFGSVGKALGITAATEANSAEVTYDMRSGTDNGGMVTAQFPLASFSWEYTVHSDGAGNVLYTINKDFFGGAAQEQLNIRAQWQPDKAGSAWARVSGGDLGATSGNRQECWNTSFAQVYFVQDFDCLTGNCTPQGSLAACAIAPVAP